MKRTLKIESSKYSIEYEKTRNGFIVLNAAEKIPEAT